MNYAIAVDSSANIPADNQEFAVVPLKILTDEREFVDDQNLDVEGMVSYLESYKGRSGTSCPNVGDWLDAIGSAAHSFVITITSGLSGSYNSAMQAKNVCEENGQKVCVLDSLSTGPEMVLIARKLKDLAAEGLHFNAVVEKIRQYMTHTHLLFSLESLTNLARNGRVSALTAKAAGLLGIRIVGKASDVGTLEPMHKCRGEKKALSTILQNMLDMGYKGGRLHISHCFNLPAAKALKDMVRNLFPSSDVCIDNCTGLCSFYAEKGGLLVGFEDAL